MEEDERNGEASSLLLLHPILYVAQRLEPGPQAGQFGRGDHPGQLGIDRLDPGADRGRGGAAPVGECRWSCGAGLRD